MDLGIRGRRAIVGGASKGLARACTTSLAREQATASAAAKQRGLSFDELQWLCRDGGLYPGAF